MKRFSNISLIICLTLLVIMCIILSKKNKAYSTDTQAYKDSINVLMYDNIQIELENDSLININDSLLSIEPIIKTIYREKYIIINHSDINQLDSIIRTSF